MATPRQVAALRNYKQAVDTAKAYLNGPEVELVMDSFDDRVPTWLTVAASEASMAISKLQAQLTTTLMVNEERQK